MRAGASGSRRGLGIGAVAAVAAVGADELAVETIHLRVADLTPLTRGFQCLRGSRLFYLLFAHLSKYKGAWRA